MAIKICKQINQNECGVCVLHTLVQYYHKKEVCMTELLEKAKLTTQGLSIYDLEQLGDQYGLCLESYTASVDELLAIKHHDPFILMLKHDYGLHYVIAIRNKKQDFEIYCSQKGHYQVSAQQLESMWTGVYIDCTKQLFSFKNSTISKPLKFNDFKAAVMINIINFIYLILCLFCSSFMQQITNQITTNIYMNTIISIAITFLIAYLCQYLLRLFISLINQKRNYQSYQWIHQQVMKKLAYKYNDFFYKVEQNYLINLDDFLFTISNFYTIKLSEIFTNIVLILAVIFISGLMNFWMLTIVLASIAINVSLSVINYWYQKLNLHEIQKEINQYHQQNLKYLDLCKSYSYREQLNANLNTLQKFHSAIKNRYYKNGKFLNEWSFWDGFCNISTSIVLVVLAAWLIQTSKLTLAQLIFLVSLFQLISQHIKSLCHVPSEIIQVKHAKQIVTNILDIDNLSSKKEELTSSIVKVKIEQYSFLNDTLLTGSSGIGKTHLLKCVAHKLKSDFEIIINELNKSWLGDLWFIDNCIYVDQQSTIEPESIEYLLYHSEYQALVINTLNMAHIAQLSANHLSSGQKQILNFLNLLNFKQKVILLDEALANLDHVLKTHLLTQIKPIIVANNFVISVDHNQQYAKYYQYHEVMNEPLS